MSLLKPESRGNTGGSVDKSYSFVHDHKLCTCNSSSQDFLNDFKCLLNHEDFVKGYSCDQINVSEPDVTLLSTRYVDKNAKVSGEIQIIEEYCTTFSENSAAFCLDKPSKDYYSHAKSDQNSWLQELEYIADESFERTPMSKDMEESRHSNAHFMYLDCEWPNKNFSDLDSQWSELTKIEPWWHSADKDDVAPFVSRRSSAQIRNCDLPEPHALHFEKGSDDGLKCFNQVKKQIENKRANVLHVADCSQGKDAMRSYVADHFQGNFASVNTDTSLGMPGSIECVFQGLDATFSNSNSSTAKVDSSVTLEQASVGLDKTQLLEALCHSQTRAREAEKLAQEACDEKDHIIELFFRQASYLFAYKQWLRILQIETLCLQHGSKSRLPSVKNMIFRKNNRKTTNEKPGKDRCCICKCAFAFAIGLSLAGAGLLAGWTIGWLFQVF